jgi:hypothetical protein
MEQLLIYFSILNSKEKMGYFTKHWPAHLYANEEVRCDPFHFKFDIKEQKLKSFTAEG